MHWGHPEHKIHKPPHLSHPSHEMFGWVGIKEMAFIHKRNIRTCLIQILWARFSKYFPADLHLHRRALPGQFGETKKKVMAAPRGSNSLIQTLGVGVLEPWFLLARSCGSCHWPLHDKFPIWPVMVGSIFHFPKAVRRMKRFGCWYSTKLGECTCTNPYTKTCFKWPQL